ncbi:MAG TPA: AgmX/PglI C-terminal domain-containing protein [Kofleriaceae bacterium]|nr:AgmX/PglI C-terminal domain-containing protein [Kofleriaceae bacterium]
MKRTELPIASPCAANWDTMTPRGRALFCDECKTLVHDLSKMQRAEAAEFMRANVGEQLCIKYSFDEMGTIKFADPAATAVIPANMLRPSVRALAAATAIVGATSLYQHGNPAPQTLVAEQQHAPMVLSEPATLPPLPPALVPPPPPPREFDISVGSFGTMGGAVIGTADFADALGARPAVPKATVTVGTVTVENGGYDAAIVRRYIKRNYAKFRYCYEKELASKPELKGTVALSFTIASNGATSDVSASGVDAELDNCVVDIVKSIEFPRPKAGAFTVKLPLKLQLSAD